MTSGAGLDKAMLAGDDDFWLDHDGLIRDWFVFGAPDEVANRILAFVRRNLRPSTNC